MPTLSQARKWLTWGSLQQFYKQMAQEVWGPQKEEEVFSFPEPRHKEEL